MASEEITGGETAVCDFEWIKWLLDRVTQALLLLLRGLCFSASHQQHAVGTANVTFRMSSRLVQIFSLFFGLQVN